MVKARATNFGEDYDYCRVCKKELSEMSDLVKISPFEPITVTFPVPSSYFHPIPGWSGTVPVQNGSPSPGISAPSSLPTHAIPPPIPKFQGALGWGLNSSKADRVTFDFGSFKEWFPIDTAFPIKRLHNIVLDISQLELPSFYEWQVDTTGQICKIVEVNPFAGFNANSVQVP